VRLDLLEPDPSARSLQTALGCHPLVAQLLWRRGMHEAADASAFLAPRLADLPDPALLKGMPAAVARLVRAIEQHERITAYGDYDVDGVSSTALLVGFLRACGADVDFHVPHRLRDGYGLNTEAARALIAGGTRVLVTLDCGVTAVAEIDEAVRLGADVVVVDHHTAPAELPRATAILNPWQPGCTYPTRHLCAAGVTFLLCAGLRRELRARGFFERRPEPNLKQMLDLVALATIADVVPLTGANRILVHAGLSVLATTAREGLRALRAVAALPEGPLTAGQVAFRLAPRINAAGRLDDAGRAVRLLLSTDAGEAARIARELDAANAERQDLERHILDEAVAEAERRENVRALVLAGEGWHAGVVGIVASRLVDRFHLPAVVVGVDPATGVGKGSGRSIEAFHLHEALAACSEHLVRFGGHKHAAGLTVERDRLPAFRAAFEAEAARRLADHVPGPRLKVDALVNPADLSDGLCQELASLAPFGAGNPEPVLLLAGAAARPRVVGGKEGRAAHLKLTLADAPLADAIGFGLGDVAQGLPDRLDLAFTLGFDEYRGERRLQLRLRHVRPAA
jgi:single-stranded-DNA-specific exonuclease